MQIYLELRGKRWIRVSGRLKQVVVSKGRKSLRYVLIGETISGPPQVSDAYSRKIPSSKLNKIILRLIESRKDHTIVFEKTGVDEYTAKTDSKEALALLEEVVKEVFASGRKSEGSESSPEE